MKLQKNRRLGILETILNGCASFGASLINAEFFNSFECDKWVIQTKADANIKSGLEIRKDKTLIILFTINSEQMWLYNI